MSGKIAHRSVLVGPYLKDSSGGGHEMPYSFRL